MEYVYTDDYLYAVFNPDYHVEGAIGAPILAEFVTEDAAKAFIAQGYSKTPIWPTSHWPTGLQASNVIPFKRRELK